MSHCPSALDVPDDAYNDYERKLVANVREHGWQNTYVFAEDGNPAWGYSIGFWLTAKIPEIIVFGLPNEHTYGNLHYIYELAQSGFVPQVGVATRDIVVGYDCFFFPIDKPAYDEYPLSSTWFYGNTDYPCLQMVWPDQAGRFPWQEGFNERFRKDQPDLSPGGWLSHLRH